MPAVSESRCAGQSLVGALRTWARTRARETAVVLVRDTGTTDDTASVDYGQLDEWARSIAVTLRQQLAPGGRALLLLPSGPEFTAAYLGCLYAGLAAVPAPLPGGRQFERRRVAAIAADSGAGVVLTVAGETASVHDWLTETTAPATRVVAVDDRAALGDPAQWDDPGVAPDDVALIQYTSGSTGNPKGVVVTHANLVANARNLAEACELTAATPMGGWLPMYHDMGLLGTLTPALYLGTTCALMSSTAFIKRPHLWLRTIDRFGLVWSSAPDFAYGMCLKRVTDEQIAGLDLSRWRWAGNGAEPIRAATVRAFGERFARYGLRPEALTAGYGLAEATLFVSRSQGLHTARVATAALERHEFRLAEPGEAAREIVSCGPVGHFRARIVEPGGHRALPPGQVGELVLQGAAVCAGYWQAKEETEQTFGLTLDGEDGHWLRTGDLAALHDGNLHITGRCKETLVIRGRNLYPQDIEHELRLQHPELESVGAAFTVPAAPGTPGLMVVHEVRTPVPADDHPALISALRRTINREFGLDAQGIALVSRGTVLRTTSGKVRRGAMRDLCLRGELNIVHADKGWHAFAGTAGEDIAPTDHAPHPHPA